MSNATGTFFWLSFVYMFIKSKTDLSPQLSGLFLLIVMIFMYFINMTILQEHCGNINTFTVLKATVFPWLFIFGNMMFILTKFTWWKTPFSNTFGLLIARFSGCNTAFIDMLQPQEQVGNQLHYVYSDPSLLVNKFTLENFEATVTKLSHIINTQAKDKIEIFKQFIRLKEAISEWIWYLLTASITISISYNSLISSKCVKTAEQYTESHNNAVAQTTPEVKPSVYTVTE